MKTIERVSVLFAANFLFTGYLHAQTNITLQQAQGYINRQVTVCDMITGGNVQAVSEDAPIVLYLGDSASHQNIEVVFSKRTRKKFSYDPEKKLPDHQACISGKLLDHDGQLFITIKSEKQIKVPG